MSAELPERLAHFNTIGALRAKLNSKKLFEVKKYAKGLGIHNYSNKNKSVIIDEILEKAEENEETLYQDWMTKIDNGRPIWRQNIIDPSRRYSLKELRNVAKNLGIPISNKTRGDLIALIQSRTRQRKEEREEKEEALAVDAKEEKIPHQFEIYEPTFTTNQKFHKTTLSLHDIPPNPDLIASIINWAFRANIEELTDNKAPEGFVLHMTISAMANVSGYDIETKKPKSYRGDHQTNMLALGVDILNRKISKKEITKWLRENDEHFQRMLEKSDMYAEIENIAVMNINFKMTEISGEGFVTLKKPEEFPNIFSPVSEADCFFLCLEEAGLKFKTGMTLHQVKQGLSIGSFSVSKESWRAD